MQARYVSLKQNARTVPDRSLQVEVEVIQNYFDKDKPSKSSKFRHPHPLKHYEVDILHDKLDHSAEFAADHVREGGRDRVDRLGLGMMGPEAYREEDREEQERELDNQKRERVLNDGEDEHKVQRENTKELKKQRSRRDSGGPMPTALSRSDSDESEGPVDREDEAVPHNTYGNPLRKTNTRGTSNDEYELGRVSSRVSAVFGGAKKKGRQLSISKRFSLGGLGKQASEEEIRPRDMEEGRAAGNAEGLAPPNDAGRPILSPATTQRSSSPPRNLSLRFAPDTAQSSETAPGPASYKRPAPNPSLSMYRSSTLQPGKPSQKEETPKGNQYYRRGRHWPCLGRRRWRIGVRTLQGTSRSRLSCRSESRRSDGRWGEPCGETGMSWIPSHTCSIYPTIL
jgi:hypothetical protein